MIPSISRTVRRGLGLLAVVTLAVALEPAGSSASPPPPSGGNMNIVVKVDLADGYRIKNVLQAFPVAFDQPLVKSRGIYRVRCVPAQCRGDVHRVGGVASSIAHEPGVVYAIPEAAAQIAGSQFHSWPFGQPLHSSAGKYRHQDVITRMALASAHERSTGAGVTIAVLDTGVDDKNPVLAGHVLRGWNYVDDNDNTSDGKNGIDSNSDGHFDSAAGHGTFIGGLIRLMAPDAQILPERVLDSDGNGTVFTLVQAIQDAVAAGAQIINLSLGTTTKLATRLLSDAVEEARNAGAMVVVAAGNAATDLKTYPAADSDALSVGALDDTESALAGFSNRGDWVDVAAPGADLVGPRPGHGFVTWSGTSFSTALVAGQAALLRSLYPSASNRDILDAITHSAQHDHVLSVHYGAIDVLSSFADLQPH